MSYKTFVLKSKLISTPVIGAFSCLLWMIALSYYTSTCIGNYGKVNVKSSNISKEYISDIEYQYQWKVVFEYMQNGEIKGKSLLLDISTYNMYKKTGIIGYETNKRCQTVLYWTYGYVIGASIIFLCSFRSMGNESESEIKDLYGFYGVVVFILTLITVLYLNLI